MARRARKLRSIGRLFGCASVVASVAFAAPGSLAETPPPAPTVEALPPAPRMLQADNGFALALRPGSDGRLQGSAAIGNAHGQVLLQPEGDGYAGTLTFAGSDTPVTLTPGDTDDQWVFADGQTRLILTGSLTTDSDTAEPQPLPLMNPGWERYADADGGVFEYPPDWKVIPNPQGLQLVPADHQPQREVIGVTLGPARGVTRANDPRVGQQLDAWVTSLNRTARRTGPPSSFTTRLGPASVYRYTGQHPTLGGPAAAKVCVVISGPKAIAFLLSADAGLMARREPVVDRIVASLGLDPQLAATANAPADPATLDERLLGSWHGENVYRGDSEISANSRFTYHFKADGTVIGGTQSAVNVNIQDHQTVYSGGRGTGTREQVMRGRWTAMDGTLTVRWDDGRRLETRYTVHGKQVAFRDANGKLINFIER
ncbi:MAG: hypothetical protein AAGI68_07510 [Planctomycetota bacterium]